MATFNKFQQFIEEVYSKSHDFGSDTIEVALTNVLPVNTNTVLANITEIAYTNISARVLTLSSSGQTAGIYKAIFDDLVLTATGAVATFRYVVIFNQTSTGDMLIGWYDYGSAVTMANGETFTVDSSQVNGILQDT